MRIHSLGIRFLGLAFMALDLGFRFSGLKIENCHS